MKRRAVLALAGGAVSMGLAGCSSESSTPSNGGSSSPTATPTQTPQESAFTTEDFIVNKYECNPAEFEDVTISKTLDDLTVSGNFTVEQACKELAQESVWDAESKTVTTTVFETNSTSEKACPTCAEEDGVLMGDYDLFLTVKSTDTKSLTVQYRRADGSVETINKEQFENS